MEIIPLGDAALLVRVREGFENAPDDSLDDVLTAMRAIEQAGIAGVKECTSAYTSIGVFFDAAEVIRQAGSAAAVVSWLSQKINEAVQPRPRRLLSARSHRPLTEIPFCADREFALDLPDVASHTGLTEDDVIRRYCAAEYRVACVGFTPGFPYLLGLPKELAVPRRAVPRKEVPPGSVAIGGGQTGIYPLRSPGGWNIIGGTSLQLFDPKKEPPALLQTGDRVRFCIVTREELERRSL
jgi:KipI family sensor histidine kinase inhibitor